MANKRENKYRITLLTYYLELFSSTNEEIKEAIKLAIMKGNIDDNYLLLSELCSSFENHLERITPIVETNYERITKLLDTEFRTNGLKE